MRAFIVVAVSALLVPYTQACFQGVIEDAVGDDTISADEAEKLSSALEKVYYEYDEKSAEKSEPKTDPPTQPPPTQPPTIAPHTHEPPPPPPPPPAPAGGGCGDCGDGDIELDEPQCKSQILKDMISENIKADWGGDLAVLSQELQVDAVEFFKGDFEVICSQGDFAWINWYSDKKMCKHTQAGVTCLIWKD